MKIWKGFLGIKVKKETLKSGLADLAQEIENQMTNKRMILATYKAYM